MAEGITEKELERGLAVAGAAAEPMILVSARSEREKAVGRFFDKLADLLEVVKPAVEVAAEELKRQAEEERRR